MALADGISFTAASGGTGTFVFGSSRNSFLTLAQGVTTGELVNGQTVSYLAQDSLSNPTQREWGHGTFSSAGNGSIVRTAIEGTVANGVAAVGSPLNFSVPPVVSLTALADDFGAAGLIAESDLTFYCSPTGSDSNPGTITQPFATLLHALNTINEFNFQLQFVWNIVLQAGTYPEKNQWTIPAANQTINNFGFPSILGDTVTPSNVVLSRAIGFFHAQPVGIDIGGFTARPDPTDMGMIFAALGEATFFLHNFNWDSTNSSASVFLAQGGGFINPGNAQNVFVSGITIGISGAHRINFMFEGTGGGTYSVTSSHFNFAASYTMHGWMDFQNSTYMTWGSNSFTNTGTLTIDLGNNLFLYSSINSDTGALSDFPGTVTGSNKLDGTISFTSNAINRSALFGRSQSGAPTTSQLSPGTWGVWKDTGGGGVVLAYNDAGTIKTVALT